MLSGGSDRVLREVAIRVVVLGIAVAAMSNLTATGQLVQTVGAALWSGIVETVQAAL
jgi:hypothetical protein